MLNTLRKWIGSESTQEEPSGLEASARRAAKAFEGWLDERFAGASASGSLVLEKCDEAFSRMREETGSGEALPESFAADAACFLGEEFRKRHGGAWEDSPLWGPHVRGFGGLPEGRFHPMAIAEKKWEAGKSFTLAAFFTSLPPRIEAEQGKPASTAPTAAEYANRLRGKTGDDALREAGAIVEDFRGFWRSRVGMSPPLSLMGVREVDGFLRSHYFVSFLGDGHLVQAGIFVGEVGRGLFEGVWDFTRLESADRAALRYPELEYYPVGRIYKMMTERPSADPLDEYLRLIPSARAELRKQGAT